MEEIFVFTPLISRPLMALLPLPEGAGGKGGGLDTAIGLLAILVLAV